MLSRTADNLFWLGRYMERAEGTARLLRSVLVRLTDHAATGRTQELAGLLPPPAGSGRPASGPLARRAPRAGGRLTPLPAAVDFDSSAPGTTARGDTSRLAPAALSVLVVLFGFLFALRRAARSGGEPAEPARSVPEGGVS